MRTWLRPGARVAALVAVSLTPLLTGSGNGTEPASSARPPATVQPADLSQVLAGNRDPFVEPTALPQQIEPQTTLVSRADLHRKFRVDGRGHVWTISGLASHDLPAAAMAAYKAAAASLARTDPSCQIPWTLLAGIGRVESDHGRYAGSVLASDGVSRPAIIGVALNGRGPVAAIHDTDDGRLDGDTVWDRAVGPMQFIPSTWSWAGRDGDGDGKADPNDIDDTALAAAAYLCSGSGSLLDDATAKAAIFRYNPSDYYVALVQAFERGYRTGVFVLPSPPPPPGEEHKKTRTHHRDRDRDRDRTKASATSPSSKPKPGSKDEPDPKPSKGSSSSPTPSTGPSSGSSGSSSSGSSSATSPTPTQQSPTPTPDPTPTQSQTPDPTPDPTPTKEPLTIQTVTGTLAQCNGGEWCLDARQLDLGPAGHLTDQAAEDYDKDGTKEVIAEELAGLAGTSVTIGFASGTAPAAVYVIEGLNYRYADGTFA
jgi:hypothetical protein